MEAPKKYRIMAFKDFVPDRVRFLLLLFFAICFQFSGGIYLASVSNMVGGKALMQEDIMMAGYASFVGMTIAFPLLFRFKFRFTSRTLLTMSASVVLVCNIISMYTANVPLLILTCFVAGMFRMVGTFECLSSIQLVITPTRDFTVFFAAVYFIVLGSVQLTGITTVYTTYFAQWEYMHLLIIGLMLFIILCARVLLRHFRFMKRLPLYGIDWAGAVLWSTFLLSSIFVMEYGEHLDWTDSVYIRIGIVTAVATLGLSIYRMFRLRRPFIAPPAFLYKNVGKSMLLFLFMMVFLSTPNVFQNTLTNGILQYDSLNNISLNWWVFVGVGLGILLGFFWLSRKRWPYKPIIFIGFMFLTLYMGSIYFLVDAGINKEVFILPSIFRGAAYGLLYYALTLFMSEGVPFPHFFQMLCVIGFVRSCLSSVFGSALFSNWMTHATKEHLIKLTQEVDILEPITQQMPVQALYGEFIPQALMVSIKEIIGWMVIVSIAVLMGIICTRFFRPLIRTYPKMKRFRQYIKGFYRLKNV